MNTVAVRDRRGGWRRILSLSAIGGGICLIGAAGLVAWNHATAPPVYQYVLGETVAAADLGGLAPLAEQKNIKVRRATIVSTDHPQPLAELEIAESAAGPVLVKWDAHIDDPFLTILPPQGDVTALAEVLERHMPAGGTLLAWWDSSRQLKMLSGVEVLFGEHLGTPLFVPGRWGGSRASIESIERSFWGTALDAHDNKRFRRFADALLADEAQGMADLRALAGGKPAVLVLHVRDAILLGQMAPRKMGVAFQDMGMMSDVHGMVRRVHAWLDEHKYPAYAVLQDKNEPVRAVALTDAASANTLAARLLPFMGNDQRDVEGATLVYRVGGFVVYELAADAAVASLGGVERAVRP